MSDEPVMIELVDVSHKEAKEAHEFAQFVKEMIVTAHSEMTKDEDGDGKGFEMADLVDVLNKAMADGVNAFKGILTFGDAAKIEPGAFMRAWTNAGSEVLEYFIKAK